jgi:hypothetical protein
MGFYEIIEERQRLRLQSELEARRMKSKKDYDRWAAFENSLSWRWVPWWYDDWKRFLRPDERDPTKLSKEYLEELGVARSRGYE